MLRRTNGSAEERCLLQAFRTLGPADRATLLAFADFLAQRCEVADEHQPPLQVPLDLPRPAVETVVGAIKRLSRSYAMLDRGLLLNETSALMSAHVLQGREAAEVIDALEALFARHYQDYRARYDPEG